MTALCADCESLRFPDLLGLDGECLDGQRWLSLYSDAQRAREELLHTVDVDEVWVVSSDQVDPINLAATLKRDRPARRVILFAKDCGGSLKSRATHAGVDSALSVKDLPSLYAMRKEEALRVERIQSSELDEAPQDAQRPEKGDVMGAGVPEKKGLFVPVVSGSGGTGKSTLCALLALSAQRRGLSVLVLDLDLQFGDMRELLNCAEAPTIDEVLALPQRLEQAQHLQGKLAVIAPPDHIDQADPLTPHIPALVDKLRSSYDLVIANTGSFWTEQHVALLEHCGRALFLVDQRPSSLRGCRKALDLCTRCGVAASPFLLVVNRCSKGSLYTSIDASCALHGMRALEVKDGGVMLEELSAASHLEDLFETKSGVCESVESLLLDLVPDSQPQEAEEVPGKPGFAALLRSKLRKGDQ